MDQPNRASAWTRRLIALTSIALLATLFAPGVASAAGPADPANSTITGTGSVVADGTDASSITITLKDSANAAVTGVTPTFTATDTNGTNTYSTCSAVDVTSGIYTCTLKSKVAETKVLAITSPIVDTGGSVSFVAGSSTKLQLLVPGEAAAPGTTTGKTGSPSIQTAAIPFNVIVNAVDATWNLVSSVTDTVHLASTDGTATLPANAALVAGTRTFSVTLRTTGATITASDVTDGAKTASTSPAIPLGPSVTINQAAGQADPTSTSPINFTVVFSATVTGFATGDVTITGTAGGTKVATVTGSGTTYNVAVSGMTTAGTVIATVPAGVALNASSQGNGASTSTDNTVTWSGVAAVITLTTSAPIPPGAHNPVILWGQGFTLGVQFAMPNGNNRSFQLQGTRDLVTWTTITTLTTDPNGRASLFYTPVTNLYYRAVFAGAADLAAANSNQVRTVVRQLALLRPTNSGATKTISRNSSITFTTTVRPARPELAPAKVSFYFYRFSSGAWQFVTKRDVFIDSAGLARTTFKFTTAGQWYVRSQANPTTYNANSVMTPVERYSVR
jgi:hypothetical protein